MAVKGFDDLIRNALTMSQEQRKEKIREYADRMVTSDDPLSVLTGRIAEMSLAKHETGGFREAELNREEMQVIYAALDFAGGYFAALAIDAAGPFGARAVMPYADLVNKVEQFLRSGAQLVLEPPF